MKAFLLLALLVLGAGAVLLLQSGSGRREARGEPRGAPVLDPSAEPRASAPPPRELAVPAPAAEPERTAREEAELAPPPERAPEAARVLDGLALRGSVHGPDGPLAGAMVRVRTLERALAESRTRADGSFELPVPAAEQALRLSASAERFAPLEIELPAERGRSFLGTLRLSPAVSLGGRVLTAAGDEAAGAEVELSTPRSNLFVHRTRTDARGRFAFPGAPPGQVRVVARGAEGGSDAQELLHEEPQELTLRLGDRAALLLLLTDSAGRGVADVPVTLLAATSSQAVHQGRTDVEGRCRFDGLEADLWDVRIVDPRFRPLVRSSLRANGVEIPIQVSAWPCVTGKVVAPGGGPAPRGTTVQVLPGGLRGDALRLGGGTRSDVGEDGSFRVCGVRPGQYQVRVEASGFAPTLGTPIDVRVEGDVDAGVIVLDAGGTLLLTLRGPSGAAAGARVELYPSPPHRQLLWADRLGREMQAAEADAQGEVRVESLAPGPVWVLVRAEDCVPLVRGPFTLTSGSTAAPEPILLETGARVRGRVTDARGPVPGAMVFLTGQVEQGATVQVTADAEGRFLSPPLPAGAWTVRARSFGEGAPHPSEPVEVVLGRGGETTVELTAAAEGPRRRPSGRRTAAGGLAPPSPLSYGGARPAPPMDEGAPSIVGRPQASDGAQPRACFPRSRMLGSTPRPQWPASPRNPPIRRASGPATSRAGWSAPCGSASAARGARCSSRAPTPRTARGAAPWRCG